MKANPVAKDIKIFIHDFNRGEMAHYVPSVGEMLKQPQIMANKTAASYADGISVHWYEDNNNDLHILNDIHKDFPQLPILGTEVAAKV